MTPSFQQNTAKFVTSQWHSRCGRQLQNGNLRVLWSTIAKCQKLWDDINSLIHDYKVAYFQASTSVSQQERGPLHESHGNQSSLLPSYWESTEAKNLFSPHIDEPVEDALDQCIEELGKAIASVNGYKLSLPRKGNLDDLHSSYEKHQLMQKALALRLA